MTQETTNTASEPIIHATALTKTYGGKCVVDGVEIDVGAGEIVGLLGPNGAGKTTTFYMIVGLVTPKAGRICFKGRDITRLPMYKRSRLGMGYLAQEPSVFRKLTVEENIRAIVETLNIPRRQRERRLFELLGELGLTELAKQKAFTLSGGERRKLEITRALAIRM